MACGHQLIEHCCRLSQGLTNPEVDAGLLTDIMKQLLFSAKMMFVKAGQSQDLEPLVQDSFPCTLLGFTAADLPAPSKACTPDFSSCCYLLHSP